MISSRTGQRDAAPAPRPSSATACSSPAGSRPAMMSPSRWEQVIPAACMNAGRPSSWATSASQVARSRGCPAGAGRSPPASDRVSGVVMLRRPGRSRRQTSRPGERAPLPAAAVVAGQHRHGPRPGAADGHDDPAGPAARCRCRARARRSARISPAPAPRQTSPAARIRRATRGLRVGQRQVPGDLRRAVGRLGPLAGQRRIRRGQLRHHPAGDEPQVRAQRPPRHAGQPRRARGEPLDHRRVQQHLRHRVQPEPDRRSRRACPPPTAGSSPAPGPPAPPPRPRPGQTPRPAASPTTAASRAMSPATRSALSPARHSPALSYCRYTVGHDRDTDLCHPETCVSPPATRPRPARSPPSSPPSPAPAWSCPAPSPSGAPAAAAQLRLPRRPAPAARPVLAVDPQGRRQDHLPLAQRRPAPRLPGLDRQRPAAARAARPARSPRRRRPRSRPPLGTPASPPAQDPARPAARTGTTTSRSRGWRPLNLWAALHASPRLPRSAPKREDLSTEPQVTRLILHVRMIAILVCGPRVRSTKQRGMVSIPGCR